jgi:RNA polymerase sigma-70 factor (sigma-E family)
MTGTQPDFDDRADALGALAYRVGYRILGDRHDAQDLTQEALARAYARWSRVGPYDEAWITRVATNLALGVVRAQQRAARRRPDPSSPAAEPGAVVAQRRQLVELLQALPKRQREVVALRYLADLSEAEVAAALGCSVGTVKQHASRGLASMRATLAAEATRPAPTPAPVPPGGTPT